MAWQLVRQVVLGKCLLLHMTAGQSVNTVNCSEKQAFFFIVGKGLACGMAAGQ